MRKVTYLCDVCKDAVAPNHFRVATGCEMDPSGNGYNTDYDYYDVCNECFGTFLSKHPSARPYQEKRYGD